MIFHAKIARREVQLPFYYICFEIAVFSRSNTDFFILYKYIIDPVLSWFVKSRKSCL